MHRVTCARTSAFGLLGAIALSGCPRADPGKAKPSASSEATVEKVPLPPGCDEAIKHVLSKAPKPINAVAYVSRSLPRLAAHADHLRGQLAQVKTLSAGRFDYRVVDVASSEDIVHAQSAGCAPQPFEEASADARAVVHGYLCVALEYGTGHDVLKYLPPERSDGNAFWLANKMEELRNRVDNVHRTLGVLKGHGALSMSEPNLVPEEASRATIQQIVAQNFGSTDLKDVDLRGGEAEVDPSLDGLIITQPSEDLTEKELRRIDQFVMRGKNVAAFVSAVNLRPGDRSMRATLSSHGLEKLFVGYGILINKDVVLDFGRAVRLTPPREKDSKAGPPSILFPQFLEVAADPRFSGAEQLLDTSFTPFLKINAITVPFVSSIELKPDQQPSARARVVMRSTPRAQLETGPINLVATGEWKQGTNWVQVPIAATVEGKLATAFPTGDNLGVVSPPTSKESARVFVLASSQFLANPLVRAGNGEKTRDERLLLLSIPYAKSVMTDTILVLKNTFDWLSNDDALAQCALKTPDP